MADDEKFTKSDLVLLMESYSNMMKMHETVLNQQSQIIEMQKKITEKQDATISKQSTLCNTLSNVTSKLDECAVKLQKTYETLDKVEDNIVYKVEDTKTIITNHNTKSIEDHSSLKNKIHLGWIGMGSLGIGLVTIIIVLLSRPDRMEAIYDMLTAISRYFGLGTQ
jgi:hypothetical protein